MFSSVCVDAVNIGDGSTTWYRIPRYGVSTIQLAYPASNWPPKLWKFTKQALVNLYTVFQRACKAEITGSINRPTVPKPARVN